MKYGYARESTQDQNLNLQLDALKKAGCTTIYKEKISETSKERPELNKLLEKLKKGDSIVVWKLDRLGGSIRDLVKLINDFNSKGISFFSLQDNISTDSSHGRFLFHIFASLAEFDRELIRERTKVGLKSARARGKNGGRPRGLTEESYKTAVAAYQLYQNKELSIADILKKVRISQGTLYKYVSYIGNEKAAKQQQGA